MFGVKYVELETDDVGCMRRFQVPPADLEAVLLTKEDIADCGVIGVESKELATELPRSVLPLCPLPFPRTNNPIPYVEHT